MNQLPKNENTKPDYSMRIRFSRGEEVKFISHLDLMKVFDRAIRRSRLPLAYSHGFNPHPQMVFGLPLSVGVTSEAEYADLVFSEPMDPGKLMEILNRNLPDGIRVLEAGPLPEKGNIMALITRASYRLQFMSGFGGKSQNNLTELIRGAEKVMEEKEIIVQKEGKGGIRDVNIRPYIDRIDIRDDVMLMLVGAGSAHNVKPEWVAAAVGRFAGQDPEPVSIHRTGLFLGTDQVVHPITGKSVPMEAFSLKEFADKAGTAYE